MTDVFFSYSSKDRERVRPIREALIAEGFDVFWDQDVPPGRDWDEWIRQHLNTARCVIVFWSEHSVQSRNVKHEAKIAEDAGKLIPVLLDHLEPWQLPMGQYTIQAIKLSDAGGPADAVQRLIAAVEEKAVRPWMSRRFAGLEVQVAALTETRGKLECSEAALRQRIMELEGANEKLRLATGAGRTDARRLEERYPSLSNTSETLDRREAQLKATNGTPYTPALAITSPILIGIAIGIDSNTASPILAIVSAVFCLLASMRIILRGFRKKNWLSFVFGVAILFTTPAVFVFYTLQVTAPQANRSFYNLLYFSIYLVAAMVYAFVFVRHRQRLC